MTDPNVKFTPIREPAIKDLEINLANRGYKLTKKYEDEKGICTVTAYREGTAATIVAKNTTRDPLWRAYRKALQFIINQLDEYERVAGKNF